MVYSFQCRHACRASVGGPPNVILGVASHKPDRVASNKWSGCNLSQELPGVEMKLTTKAICINCAIFIGLLLELYWGRPLYVIGIAALLLFLVANGVLFLISRKARKV
jgi:hypothetical protein